MYLKRACEIVFLFVLAAGLLSFSPVMCHASEAYEPFPPDRTEISNTFLTGGTGVQKALQTDRRKAPDGKSVILAQHGAGENVGKKDRPDALEAMVVRIGNLRSRPTTDSTIIDKLRKGDRVTLIKKEGNWYIVKLQDDRLGWAHKILFFKSPKGAKGGKRLFKELKEIRFQITPQGEERVTFQLNGYYPPETFAVEEGKPRVVCDFYDTRLGKGIDRLIKVEGAIIGQIRIGLYKGPDPKVRVVLDLRPDKNQDYEIQPVFFEDQNRYVLTLKKAHP